MADITYSRRLGDRREGRRIRSLSPASDLSPFIMGTRADATNSFSDSVEVTELDAWLRRQREAGYPGMSLMHLFAAAYVRTVSLCPELNRFVAGRRIFARNGIVLNVSVSRQSAPGAVDTVVKVPLDPADTVYDVYRKINEKVDEVKASDAPNELEEMLPVFTRMPRLLTRLCASLVRVADYWDKLPMWFLRNSRCHGSAMIADTSALGLPPVRRHLYDFGNLPLFFSYGARRRAVEFAANGRPVERRYVDFCISLDERICNSYSAATAYKLFRYFVSGPQLLEVQPEEVREDLF